MSMSLLSKPSLIKGWFCIPFLMYRGSALHWREETHCTLCIQGGWRPTWEALSCITFVFFDGVEQGKEFHQHKGSKQFLAEPRSFIKNVRLAQG